MALQMEYSYMEDKKAWSIKAVGEIDVAKASELRTLLSELYLKQAADIVMDLSGLSYIDSTGLGVLIGAYGRMQEKGHRILLENPRDNIAKLLRITSLDKIFC